MPSKCIMIVLDGLGDRAFASLGHRTPLQAAQTPALDRLAALGANGLYHAGTLGRAMPSENAHFAMFGFGHEDFPGRGALEALGAGVALGPGEVAVLAHLVSWQEKDGALLLVRDLPKAPEDEALALIRAVERHRESGVELTFTRTKGLFGVVVMRGEVSPFITDSNPMRDNRFLSEIEPWDSHADDPAARSAARALRRYLLWAGRTLADHPLNRSRIGRGLEPINGMVTQRAGRLKPMARFSERFGMRGLCLAGGSMFRGLAAYSGLDFQAVPDGPDQGLVLARRLALARESLGDYDFVHVHTKAPDVAAHKKDPVLKMRVIEELDRGLQPELDRLLEDPEVLLVLCSDHSTPSGGNLVHSGEPVPLCFCGAGVRRDRVERFDEVSAAGGALGCVRGREMMYLILNHLDRIRLEGIRDCPADRDFWPGDYRPFRAGGEG